MGQTDGKAKLNSYLNIRNFAGTVLIQKKDRMFAVEYVLPPAALSLDFIFRKPALASITNIYVLPFTQAVWLATVVLIFILAAALIIASFWEMKIVSFNVFITVFSMVMSRRIRSLILESEGCRYFSTLAPVTDDYS